MTSITPSTFQVNEGDSLTTSLSGFTPGSTLYFKVGGRGINKKDFASGGVKGRVQVDTNGVATISHTLRADKATEGDESFSIRVFSDKKMRNRVGEADSVSVLDTSVKAPKVGKPPKDGGGVKEQNNTFSFNDPLTGQAIISDVVYSGFFNPSNTNTSTNRAYASGQYEFEASQSTLILTLREYDWIGPGSPKPERFKVYRVINTGKFTTDKSGNLIGTVNRSTSFGLQSDSSRGFFMETAQSYSYAKGANIFSFASEPEIESALYFYSNLDGEFDSGGRFPGTPRYHNRTDITGLADTSFFQEGWWQNPFAPNLI